MSYRWLVLACLAWGTTLFAEEGEYLLHAAGCLTCHTSDEGQPLAGGRPFTTPFGIFYSPNITPHVRDGIGNWSRQDFIAALKHGTAPDGSAYFPVFPYPSYRRMTDEDAGILYEGLMQREPVAGKTPDHELAWWLGRWMMDIWQALFLDDLDGIDKISGGRGRYLVDALGHCGECHTPRNHFGVTDASRYLAGTREGPEDEAVPNITSHREDGIGKWSTDDLAYFLKTGELPDGDYTGSQMTDVIDHSTSHLTQKDRLSMADYLKRVQPLPGP